MKSSLNTSDPPVTACSIYLLKTPGCLQAICRKRRFFFHFFFIFIFLVELFSRSLLAANEGLLGYKQYMWMGCTWFCLCPILWGKDCSYLVSSTANLWVCVCVCLPQWQLVPPNPVTWCFLNRNWIWKKLVTLEMPECGNATITVLPTLSDTETPGLTCPASSPPLCLSVSVERRMIYTT